MRVVILTGGTWQKNKEKVPPPSSPLGLWVQQLVIITHLMVNSHLPQPCRAFGLIQIIRRNEFTPVTKGKPTVAGSDQRGFFSSKRCGVLLAILGIFGEDTHKKRR